MNKNISSRHKQARLEIFFSSFRQFQKSFATWQTPSVSSALRIKTTQNMNNI